MHTACRLISFPLIVNSIHLLVSFETHSKGDYIKYMAYKYNAMFLLFNPLGYLDKAWTFNGLNKRLLKSKILMNGKIGFVGNPIKLDKKSLMSAISKNKVPIVSPIGFDDNGNKYNINADVAAGFIAETLKVKRLLLLTDVEGVLDNNKKLIVELNKKKAFEYIKKGTIKGGMIPKVKTCFKTLNKGVRGVALVDGRKENAILMELLTEKGAGTLIKK